MAELVVLSLERWDDVWRRNQYLVDGLLRADPELRVLFVEPPDDPVHDMRSGRRPETGSRLTQIGDRLWRFRPVKWLPRRLDAQADARMARAARRAAVRLGFIAPMLWINDPAATDLAEQTGWPVLYDMTDDWLAADRAPAERERITRGETWLLQHASAVVACSPELVRRKESQRADIALVRNGVDTARYRMPMPRPADLPPGPTHSTSARCTATVSTSSSWSRPPGRWTASAGSFWSGPRHGRRRMLRACALRAPSFWVHALVT